MTTPVFIHHPSMKKLVLFILLVAAAALTAASQAPARFNYQGIARNGRSEPWPLKPLGLRISIRDASPGGTIVYQETHATTTNEFGVYNISVGGGTPVKGTLAAVAWDSGDKYIQVEIDVNGGTAYGDMGTRQLLSVPYALNAANASAPKLTITGNMLSAGANSVEITTATGTTNFMAKFTNPNTLGNSQLLDDGTSVGIGLTPLSAANKFQVVGLNATAINGSTTGATTSGVLGSTSGFGYAVSGLVTSGGSGTAGFFDGGTAGRGLLIPRGAVGINNNTPLNRLTVIGGNSAAGVDTNATIYGIANTAAAARKGGIMGTYDPVLAGGIGVQGLGRDGYTHKAAVDSFYFLGLAANNHIGLYGSAAGFGVVGTAPAGFGVFGATKSGSGVFGACQGASGDGVTGLSWTTGVRGTTGYALPTGVPAPPTPAEAYGVFGSAGTGTTRYGVYGISNSANGTQSIGISGAATSAVITTAVNYGVFGTASNGATNWAGYFAGNVNITGSIAKASGTFKIDHPLDPEHKILYHSFVESPDMMNIYNGNITTDANGFATVTMPDYFDALNKDFRYQLTVIGTFAQAIVKEEMHGNTFVIQTSQPTVKVSWQVTGVRNDKYANAHRVVPEVAKEGRENGKYIHPFEWGKPASAGVDYELTHQQQPAGDLPAGALLQQ